MNERAGRAWWWEARAGWVFADENPALGGAAHTKQEERVRRNHRTKPQFAQLTSLDPELDRVVRKTPAGMMFWSGTGPARATCGQCRHFQSENRFRGRCGAYRAYCGADGAVFEQRTPACKYFIKALDRLSAAAGRVGHGAEEGEDKMDLSKFTGSSFYKVKDVAEGPIEDVPADVVQGEYGKPNIVFESGRRLSVNTTNAQTLVRLFGPKSENLIGKRLQLYEGEIEVSGKPQPAVLVRLPAAPPKLRRTDPISSGPQPSSDEPPPIDDFPDDSGEQIPF